MPRNVSFAFFEKRCFDGAESLFDDANRGHYLTTHQRVQGLTVVLCRQRLQFPTIDRRQGWSNLCPSYGYWQLDLLSILVYASISQAAARNTRHSHR